MNYNTYTKNNIITKSLQVKLVPVGETRETIRRDNSIEEDKERIIAAKEIKAVSDSFYREVLEAFAKQADFDWNSLYETYSSNNGKYISAAEKFKENLSRNLTSFTDAYIKQYVKENGESDTGCTMSSAKFVDTLLPCYVSNHPEFQTTKMEHNFSLTKGAASSIFKKYFTAYEKIISGTGFGSVAARAIENFETVCLNIENYRFAVNIDSAFESFAELSDITVMNNLLSQTGISLYNELISGSYDDNGNRIKDGFNITANLYMQQNKDTHLYRMKKAKKQILTISEPAFKVDMIESKDDFNIVLRDVVRLENECQNLLKDTFSKISDTYSTQEIYINPKSLSNISAAYCDWNIFALELKNMEVQNTIADHLARTGKVKNSVSKAEENRAEKKVANTAYSIGQISNLIGIKYNDATLVEFLQNSVQRNAASTNTLNRELLQSGILEQEGKPSPDTTRLLRKYLDAVMNEKKFANYFLTNRKQEGVTQFNDEFADTLLLISEKMAIITTYYNKIRNYVTKKTNDKDTRVALCFGRPRHFEQAWQNKQEGKFGNIDAALIEKDGSYYYIVPAAKNTSKLNFPILDTDADLDSSYKYLYTKKSVKMTMLAPKLTFKSRAAIEGYETHGYDEKFAVPFGETTVLVSKKFYDDYNSGLFRENRDFLDEVIDFYRNLLDKHPSFRNVNIKNLKPTAEYKNLGEFCAEIDAQNFSITAKYLDASLVDDAVQSGNLLMFLITNQDMYKTADRRKDKYSILIHRIFQCMNENKSDIIVNNNPKIYYREALIQAKDMHPVGSILVNKHTDDGKFIPEDVYLSLCDFFNNKKSENDLSHEDKLYLPHAVTKISDRPHIKDAHYTNEMFYMQLSYTLNKDVAKETTPIALNLHVRNDMRKNGCNILAVCRGTDNLLYYYMTDTAGNKLSSGALNEVGSTDFLDKLSALAKIKRADQRDWIYDKSVAQLKNTYLEMITHKIAKMAVDNNCIIVIDWISNTIKDKHARFDASVYKKFENTLCKTLSCYTDPDRTDDEPGSIRNPLQLAIADETNPGGQNGIVFFTSSAYIKNICPSGFVSSLIDTYNKNTVISKMEFLSKMRSIRYDDIDECYKFEFTLRELGTRLSPSELKEYDGADHVWTVSTSGIRIKFFKEKKQLMEFDGTETLNALFSKKYNASEKIDVSSLLPKEVSALYEVFILYVNGYTPKYQTQESHYFSPVIQWNNLAKISYDEMTVKRLAEKGIIVYHNVMEKANDDATKADVEKIKWLNFLFNTGTSYRK